jgi:uncharacterized protein YkvS
MVLLEFGLEFMLVMEFAQVGTVFKLGLQGRVVKLGWESWVVQVGGVQVECREFLVSIF